MKVKMKVKKKVLAKKIYETQNASPELLKPVQNETVPPVLYERKAVLEILKMIKPGVASKDLVESMKYFFLSGKEIVTYNDRISISHPLQTSFSTFVKADAFFNVMAKSTAGEITIAKGKDKINVKAKGLNVNLTTVVDDDIVSRIKTIRESLVDAKWFKLPDNFSECINLCSFAASKAESESTLSCVRIEPKCVIASDNNRIAMATMDKSMNPMFIKASEVKNLISIKPIAYSLSTGWLHFKNEQNCIFSIREVKGDYPNFHTHFKFDGERVDLPKNLTEGTDLASIFTTETDQPFISITIFNNKCLLSVSSEFGGMDFTTPIEYSGQKLEFIINPDFLLEMMKYSTSIVLTKGKAKLEAENFSLLTSLYEG